MIDGRQAAQNDITDEFLSLFHSVVGIVWVVHLVLVRAKVIAVDKTQFGKPLLNFTKKRVDRSELCDGDSYVHQILADPS